MIAIINYGSGNVRAIGNIYDRLNVPYVVLSKSSEFTKDISKIILPGVGAFDQTMSTLISSGFKSILEEYVLENKLPTLGICVGMQILSNGSDEGNLEGLGWIPGRVKKFNVNSIDTKPKLPHMGWNTIHIEKNTPLMLNIDVESGFYFIHSYFFECDQHSDVLLSTEYGVKFSSAINRKNIFGTQFHPEKSHQNGISLLKNFANLSLLSD